MSHRLVKITSCAALGVLAVLLVAAGGCGEAPTSGSGVLTNLLDSTVIDNGREFGGNAGSVAPYRDELTADEAYHLLRRAAFGATPEQVDAAVSRGLTATVENLLSVDPESGGVEALVESYEDDTVKKWLVYMIEGKNPLREKMSLFWHDRFAASARVLGGRDRGLARLHWEMLRGNALGDYRAFLEALTIDPLVLIWLDGANSPKDSPNENYAREFWELYTLGRDVLYTEEDVREAARAFTGITLLRESDLDARPIYDLTNHDETDKTIFPDRAAPANHDYLTTIDLTLDQPEAARYVARNLFAYFVHDDPPSTVVDTLASVFVESDFEIAPLVRVILRSQAMFSEPARGARIDSPVEHLVGVARTLDMHINSEESREQAMDRLVRDLRGTGQELLNPPSVQGWKENEAWLKDPAILARASALSRTMEFGPTKTQYLPYHLLPPTEQWDQREVRGLIVDAMAGVFHLDLTEEEREIYIEVLDQNGWRALHLVDPEQQPRHVFEMIRLMAMDERVMGS